MDIIFESNTTQPEEFELPNGEVVVNFGHVMIIEGDYCEQSKS